MKKMKKLFLTTATAIIIFTGSTVASSAWCIHHTFFPSPGIKHVFIDVNCDGFWEFIEQYQWDGVQWIFIGRL
jgi:hypothetical protein